MPLFAGLLALSFQSVGPLHLTYLFALRNLSTGLGGLGVQLSWQRTCLASPKLWVPSPALHKGGLMFHTCDPRAWACEQKDQTLRVILGYTLSWKPT